MSPSAAIAGLGITDVGKVYGRSSANFAADAVRLAAADAGVDLAEIDGLLLSEGISGGVELTLAKQLGLRNLAMLAKVQSFGSTAIGMVQMAAQAIMAGTASVVACTFGDAPLRPATSSASAYSGRPGFAHGFGALPGAAGVATANSRYAIATRRHMEHFGTTSEQLGTIAVSTRRWAQLNPLAQMTQPMTLEDHQSSRVIADPLRLLDCCLVSNGGIAVIVTSADRAEQLRQPPVHMWGWGQCHPGTVMERGSEFGLRTGAIQSGQRAFAMAGVTPKDIDVSQLYDCYTYTVLVTLEDYGFCAKGEGGPFAASGALAPGGSLPTNTGGGELSGYYLWGMTPLSEAIIQARGQAGERQVADHDLVIVSGNGGQLDHHATLIIGGHRR